MTNTAPIETSGMAIHISAASAAFSTESNNRQAIRAISAGIAPTNRRESALTPNSEAPNSEVEARMRMATMGGWSRYPNDRERDQSV